MADDMKFRWIKAVTRSGLHDTTKLVALALWNYANKHGGNAHPGNRTVASDLGKSVRTVKTHMGYLRDEGWIARTSGSNSHPNRDWADVYRLIDPDDRVQPALHPVAIRATAENPQPETGPGATDEIPGAISGTSGAISGIPGATQVALQQVSSSKLSNKFSHHPDSEESGPPVRADAPLLAIRQKEVAIDEEGADWVIDYIEDCLSQEHEPRLDHREVSLTDQLVAAGVNYKAILNTIRKKRRDETRSVRRTPKPAVAAKPKLPLHLQNNGPDLDPYGDDEELLRKYNV